MKCEHTRLNRIIAGLVFLISITFYIFLLAPTISFWDCSEYIAAGSILGIPHPPGNPLYMMIARVATVVLWFVKDPAYRINLITPLTGALCVMLAYLTIIRIFIGFTGTPDTSWKKFSIYLGGIVGALFAAFGNTMLFCSVEAEVNTPQILPIMLCTWLAVVWAQSSDPRRDRFLLLISYIAFLGIGIHMYSMIVMAPLFMYIIIVDRTKLRDWRFWGICVAMGFVMYNVSMFFITGGAAILISLFMSFVKGKHQANWRICFGIAFFAMLGFSVHLYIPIRSSLNPSIDENHPATYKAFVDFLDRKQYGSESMISRMLWRRGSWSHQFGIEEHMGFGGFFITQFFHFSKKDTEVSLFSNGMAAGVGKLLVYLMPVMLMLFGWYYLFRKSRNQAVLLCSLTVATTVGIVFYMNFADGTRPEKRDYEMWLKSGRQGTVPTVHREVRIRDYFWVPGFFFYGMWIGLATGGGLLAMYSSRRRWVRFSLAPLTTVLASVSPVLPMTQNMAANDRRGNYVAYDYAYNLLMTCEKDGILITNGDNDTFPLWALQEAFDIRRDVRIVNLSLANTEWYLKQLKNFEPKVPMRLSDSDVDNLTHELNPFRESTPYTMTGAAITVRLPGRDELNILRIQDKIVLHIMDANRWHKPVYFSTTVSNNNMMGLQPYLKMQGLAFRVMPHPVPNEEMIDVDRTAFLLDKVYRFRGLGTTIIPKDKTTYNMISNYTTSFIQIALTLHEPLQKLRNEIQTLAKAQNEQTDGTRAVQFSDKKQEYESKLAMVVEKLDRCVLLVPWDQYPRVLRQQVLISHELYDDALVRNEQDLRTDPDNDHYRKFQKQILEKLGSGTKE